MKMPQMPPDFEEMFQNAFDNKRIENVLRFAKEIHADKNYLHWDELRRRPERKGVSLKEWWLALKMKRKAAYREIPLMDKTKGSFWYYITDSVQELLHDIDSGAGGLISLPDSITNSQTRDRYVLNSLIEEAITSSQLEGAVATREVAKDMIKSGRRARDKSEQMILNNFFTMQYINDIKDRELTPDLVLDVHRRVTENTLDKPDAVGRLRRADESVKVVDKIENTIFHDPPPADELDARMKQMCDFANGKTPAAFVHPVIRAVILHFWLAYDHPFYDGNGRTARALFYWAMLKEDYWLFQYISISRILVKAPAKYGRSFLYTETDGNDLNYFIIYQAKIINRAIKELNEYIDRKRKEVQDAKERLKFVGELNHRQQALILHALRHPLQEYTIESHRVSHGSAYATARSDLLDLLSRGLLTNRIRGKALVFSAVSDLPDRLKGLSTQN
jgi:Fic family protein